MGNLRVAKEFLESYLPAAVLEALDLSTLQLMPNSYVDKTLKAMQSDVVYQVKFKEGGTAYICCLFEHQSTPDPIMPVRIWQYVVNIWLDELKQHKGGRPSLPLIVPLVFYSGTVPYTEATDIRELIQAPSALIDTVLFQQTFKLVDLNQIPDEKLKKQQWAGMMALMMRHIRDRDIVLFLKQVVDALRHLEQSGGTDYVILLLNYCLTSGETVDLEEFVTVVQQQLSPETGEKIMTIAEQLIEKGKREGRLESQAKAEAKGEARGEAKGEHNAARKIARRAFEKGHMLAHVQELTGLSEEELLEIQKESTVH